MVILPIVEVIILSVSVPHPTDNMVRQSINYYVLVLVKAMLRLYLAYLIYSYFMRVDRGESLLVEYGERRLSKMIDKINEEQFKQ